MEGKLSKWTNVVKGWQYRWFVLDNNSGTLSYYTSEEKMARGHRRGRLKLKGAAVGIDDEFGNAFSITTEYKVFHLQAKDREELQKWVRCLEDTISNKGYTDSSPSMQQLDTLLLSTTVQDFGKKLEEADAFLQIMTQQINSLETKMELEHDTERKSKYESLINHSKGILDEVKQSIVLLQIAKNNSLSVSGQYEPLNNISKSNMTGAYECRTSQVSVDCTESSVSSVDEEEDFYDANDSHETRSHSKSDELFFERTSIQGGNNHAIETCTIFSPQQSLTTNTFNQKNIRPENEQEGNSLSFRKPDGDLDYDALYDISDQNNVSVDNQGSVVAHLLSQVKIGMDLTKVTLPTFILETRSLLEMYADYFAHPDMFVKISDLSTERERMVQVVRWYICSYHAGRKSTLAKKPYNPVLGEIFQCHWDVPGTDPMTGQLVSDGPVPWCNTSNLAFVAEQVSHHPPVSAFYAEHFNKKISFNAFIWTKSKFLGLSIGVHNIGHGVINVLKYDEQYVVTFPNGYGRSILTVPWIELGGAVTITCRKSGYRADIDFITKPFYGGKKHRICGEIFAANEKEPFLTLTGEWNGIIEAKWSNGKTEQFADVKNLPIIKKHVRPIGKQEDMESRKLWKEVTAGLKLNNVAHATKAKCNIEQKQRMEAQKRKEVGLEWETKLFRKSDDCWIYKRSLSERICELEAKDK